MPVPKASNAIEALRFLLAAGAIRIDEDGSFWRVFTIERWGKAVPITPPRRIDYWQPNGYRYVGLCWQGAQFCGLAHRLLWLLKHGFIPIHKRLSGGARSVTNVELMDYGGPDAYRRNRDRDNANARDRFAQTYVPHPRERKAKPPRLRMARVQQPKPPKVQPQSQAAWPFNVGGEVDPLIELINQAVPKHLPPLMREDVCQELAIVYLEAGTITTADVTAALKHVRKHAPMCVRGEVSLDAFFAGTTLRRIDTLAAPEPESQP